MESDNGEDTSIQYYFRVSDPNNNRIFSRVPYERRTHWLKLWNPTNYPEDVSVYDSFNTLAYCFSFDYQTYHNYAFGRFSTCEKALNDLKLALRASGTISSKDTQDGRIKYQRAIEDLKASSGESGEIEHIFKFRQSPVDYSLLKLYEPGPSTH